MSYKAIVYEAKERIAYLTLNRPRLRNAYNDTMGRVDRELEARY
jgi:enoyl-CoA hydratase/carnithine racemase